MSIRELPAPRLRRHEAFRAEQLVTVRLRRLAVGALLATTLLIALVLVSLSQPAVPSGTTIRPEARLLPPSSAHWLGTDHLGRDVLARVLLGARVSLVVGASVAALSGVLGAVLGIVAGSRRRLDEPLMRVLDGVMAFPGVLLGIAVVLQLGPRLHSVVLALTCVYVPVVARLARGATLVAREQPYVDAARAAGASEARILRRHVLPNIAAPVVTHLAFVAGAAILAEAALSFLGASVDPRLPTWGAMLRDAQHLFTTAWWTAVGPGLALFMSVLACIAASERARRSLDPHRLANHPVRIRWTAHVRGRAARR